ncbi:hypothetical protein PHMEG_00014384 [Phytophthora megakarya]|uniref:Uncharacterized protein n=1 Tax=Phytophthora megakarya TaxID=4795 RepID=A0A225W4F9_9STRA|nr:hypothetical protein PHMEG_00014384 [Phytophthora megakarya]
MDSDESEDDWTEKPIKPGCSVIAMNGAAANSHLHVVQWLQQNRNEGCTKDAMDFAARNGHFEVVKWLHENRKEDCSTKAMDEAAKAGHLEVVKWLHEHRTEGSTTKAMDGAAASGALDVMKWLKENRSEGCTRAAMIKAARNGHLRVLHWLHDNCVDGWSTSVMDNAAMHSKFEIVLLLDRIRGEGCSPGLAQMRSLSPDVQKTSTRERLQIRVFETFNLKSGDPDEAQPSQLVWSVPSLMATEVKYRHYQFTFSLLEAVNLKNLEMKKLRQWAVDILDEHKLISLGEEDESYTDEELDQLKLVGEVDVQEDHEALKAAGASGDVELVEWLQGELNEDVELGIQKAAANGLLDMVMWMYTQEFDEKEM